MAAELPLQAIAELMGVPQEDRRKLFDWSNRMIGADDPEFQKDTAGMEAANGAAAELFMYAQGLAELRRADPQDDIISKLLAAEIEGDRLGELEFEMFFLLLAVAGNETTRNATAHGMKALIDHPDQFDKLKADPDLLPGAIEEILRWATPVMHFRRTALEDYEVGGTLIKAGDKVVMWHISANRDETVFDDPSSSTSSAPPTSTSPSVAAVRTSASAPTWPAWSCASSSTRSPAGCPTSRLDGEVEYLRSNFIGGIKHMPVAW